MQNYYIKNLSNMGKYKIERTEVKEIPNGRGQRNDRHVHPKDASNPSNQ